jgi:uncharacterized protein YbjT (DUF2867 family)
MIAVMGASGNTGGRISESLLATGEIVRALALGRQISGAQEQGRGGAHW